MSDVSADATARKQSIGSSRRFIQFTLKYGTYILFVLVCSVIASMSPVFLSRENLTNILLQTAAIGIVAVGATFVLIVRGLDVSVGAIVALASLLGAGAMKLYNQPWWVGAILMIGLGVFAGWFNGFSSARLGMAPFLVTLATLTMMRGIVLALSGGKSWYGLPRFYQIVGEGQIGPLPISVAIMLLVFVTGYFAISSTVFGRRMYAVGGNPDAARMQGINVRAIILSAFVICGLCSGLGGLLLTARLNAFTPLMGQGFEFSAIAAAVIGGVSLFGGEGNMFGTLVGVLIIAVINNALNLLGVSIFMQDIVRGLIIFVAVLLDTLRKSWAEASR